jgi:hypothetical protein
MYHTSEGYTAHLRDIQNTGRIQLIRGLYSTPEEYKAHLRKI